MTTRSHHGGARECQGLKIQDFMLDDNKEDGMDVIDGWELAWQEQWGGLQGTTNWNQTDAHLKFLGALLISKSFNSITTQGTKQFKCIVACWKSII